MKRVLHFLALAAILVVCFAATYRLFIGPIPLPSRDGADAVSSASVILDAPSGNYVVLLNRDAHRRMDTSGDWLAFLNGESLVIMDDIACMVAEGDEGGKGMAESYRSRLPENQMSVSIEEPLMMLSRAQASGFDLIVMSSEFADAYRADTIYDLDAVEVLRIEGGAEG